MKKWSNKQSQQPKRQKATDPMVALLIKKLSTHIDIAPQHISNVLFYNETISIFRFITFPDQSPGQLPRDCG